MKYAKSMYRGGFLADADICDYESSRKLGLVCPFCSQAVFLRRGTIYDRKNGQPVVVKPAFAHYKNDDPLSEDCELRSARKEGQEYLQRLETESRNQRLDLYNKRLWDIFRQDMKVTSLKELKKAFGEAWIESSSRHCRHELRRSLEFYLEEARQQWKFQVSGQALSFSDPIANLVWDQTEQVADVLKLGAFDRQLHQVIFEEILEFLSTRTGGYAFQRIYQVALIELCLNSWVIATKTKSMPQAIPVFADKVKKMPPDTTIKMVVIMIVRVNWTKLFYSLEEEQ